MASPSLKSSSAEPLLIIGNGMVSWRLCQQLVERGVHESRRIIVFGEEPQAAYDRVNLTKFFELDSSEELLLAPRDWYARNDITLHSGRRILKLDTQQKLVVDDVGEEHAYGDCVLATGSSPYVPPIEGSDADNVFVYRTIEDIERIKQAAESSKSGVVIGGGLLGLEAAQVLKDFGLQTCIVQAANTLMSRQLNEDGGSYLLREVAELGMSMRLTTNTQRIIPTSAGLELEFNKGEPLSADLVVIATGIKPRDELAVDAGLSTATRGGIIVNNRLQTDDPNVYAIGECASHKGKVYGLVAPGYEMADALAQSLAGKKRVRYRGSDESCRLKLLGVEVSVFGDYMQEGDYHVHRGEKTYRSLVLKRSKLIGATVIGPWEQAAEIERAVREQRRVSKRLVASFERTGDLFAELPIANVLEWSDLTLVCNCTRTNCGQLKQAVVGGCSTVDALAQATGAGSVCGSCRPQLAQFVGESSSSFIDTASQRGGRLLVAAAAFALIALAAIFFVPGLPAAQSVQTGYYEFTRIWQDSLTKQITGYTIAGLSLLAILLSARKRFSWLNLGNYGFWRALHSWLGVATLVGVFLHTGLHLGDNLNMWLLICFLGLNLAGGLAAIAVAAERRFTAPLGGRLRALATKAHIIFFLPYPVLLGFHIAKVYLY